MNPLAHSGSAGRVLEVEHLGDLADDHQVRVAERFVGERRDDGLGALHRRLEAERAEHGSVERQAVTASERGSLLGESLQNGRDVALAKVVQDSAAQLGVGIALAGR